MMHTHVLLTCGFLCFAPLCFASSTGGVCAGSTREGDKTWVKDTDYYTLEVSTDHCSFASTPTYVTSLNGGVDGVSKPLSESFVFNAAKNKFTIKVHKGKLTEEEMKSYQVNWMATGAEMSVAGQNVCGDTASSSAMKKDGDKYWMDVDTTRCGFRGEPPIYFARLTGTGASKVRGIAEIYKRSSKKISNFPLQCEDYRRV